MYKTPSFIGKGSPIAFDRIKFADQLNKVEKGSA